MLCVTETKACSITEEGDCQGSRMDMSIDFSMTAHCPNEVLTPILTQALFSKGCQPLGLMTVLKERMRQINN